MSPLPLYNHCLLPSLTSHQNSNTIREIMVVSSHLPPWLHVLLTEKFFNACIVHEEMKKNEKNIYCLDCCFSICPHCLMPHSSHRLLQIRRYVYHDVIKLGDAQKLFDCSSVQAYTTNSAKVVFLNPRPQTRQFRGSANFCSSCDRALQEPYLFCSLSCKIDHVITTGGIGELSSFIFVCKFLPLAEPGQDDCSTTQTQESGCEQPMASTRTSSGSSGHGGVGCSTLVSTATTDIVRKKRSNLSACRQVFPRMTEISSSLMNRRKKTPTRAPLY